MEFNWNSYGYTSPNRERYPWQWLWDSCFHALIWTELGYGDRAILELNNIFEIQDDLGFVPHVNYASNPNPASSEWGKRWGRTHGSSITQPPMYGHALAELDRKEISLPPDLVEKASKGLYFLFKHRKRDLASGLVYLCHPWESGIDNSPRWDDYCPGGFHVPTWDSQKLELLKDIQFSSGGAPIYNPSFPVASVGFNALLAFNSYELAGLTGDSKLEAEAQELTQALEGLFDSETQTWIDGDSPAQKTRTLDALLVGLVSTQNISSILEQLDDSGSFGGSFGTPSVHRQEASFSPDTYWRGTVWPPTTYLSYVMCKRAGETAAATKLAQAFQKGAMQSNFSEYWDANTGEGLGASPQSWAGLALLNALED